LIAKQLNILDTTQLQTFVNVKKGGLPLYLMGEKALSAELLVLKKARKNDDAFIPKLRSLQEKLVVLDGIQKNLNKDQVFAARIDQEAVVPNKPMKPKKPLIIILSLLLGLMLVVN